jgi:aspartyl-tRNA(Asn)/glutamyl-tRNA(Gln) amidotransferase subunit A
MSWLDRSAREIAQGVRRGDVTPRAIAAEARARAAERDPAINAICADNPGLEAEADAVAARLDAGAEPPLAGVPVLIKDNIWVGGLRVAQGSRLFADHVAPRDAEAVALLRRAGALVLGIATCSEFACKGATFSPLHGITRNPVDPSLTPGGSSGGPAAAVAAGIVPLALGTDAGGSSRRPPAHVGVCGFKPTQDLIPYGPGFDEPVWGISTICPIARDMGDIALAMEVLAGVAPEPPEAIALAAAPSFGLDQPVDAEVADTFAATMEAVRAAGGRVGTARIDWPAGLRGSDALPLQYAGLAHLHAADWRDRPEAFDPDIADQIRAGNALTGAEVAAAHQAAHAMRLALRAALDRHGVIATPTTPCAAWAADLLAPAEIGGRPAAPRDHAAFTPQANHAGVPALSMPCGVDGAGRPLGLQLIGGAGRDGALIGLAQALEGILEGSLGCVFS